MSEKLSPCGLFATRDSLPEALEYANTLIAAIRPTDRVAAYTALHVVLNTALAEIEKLSMSNVRPYTDEEIAQQKAKCVADYSPEELRRHFRTALPAVALHTHLLAKAAPRLGETFGIFISMAAALYGLEPEGLATEMLDLIKD